MSLQIGHLGGLSRTVSRTFEVVVLLGVSVEAHRVSGGNEGGNAIHYLQNTLTVRIPGIKGAV